MNDRPESEDRGIERLRAEVEILRGTLRRIECAGPPSGDRCPYCSHEPPLFIATMILAIVAFLLRHRRPDGRPGSPAAPRHGRA